MKTTKEIIFEYIQKEIYKNEFQRIETKEISEKLGMQRSNVSSALNRLVRDGKLIKTNTRPVYYKIADDVNDASDSMCFSYLVGFDGSLSNAIQLAEAAILYPRKSLNVLIQSQPGCGTTTFAYKMFQFARERNVYSDENMYAKINCQYYMQNTQELDEMFFGKDNQLETSIFAKLKRGIVFIDHFDFLPPKHQKVIYQIIETGKITLEEQIVDCREIMLIVACLPKDGQLLNRKFPVLIELPELKERPLVERFYLINHFFSIEAANSMHSIEVSDDVIQALLLTEFQFNIKELEVEIRSACANAYLRVINDPNKNMFVCMNDFKGSIKQSLIRLNENHDELTKLFISNDTLFYDVKEGYQKRYQNKDNLYNKIMKQYQNVLDKETFSKNLQTDIDNHVNSLFHSFVLQSDNEEKQRFVELEKTVDKRMIDLIYNWLKWCEIELGRQFQSNVFLGICLHVNALLANRVPFASLSDSKIISTIQNFTKEYACGVQLALALKKEFQLDLPIDEIVLLVMGLKEREDTGSQGHPVLCFIMQGNHTASSLCQLINQLTHYQNVYSYDLMIGKELNVASEELKTLLKDIDNGYGIIIIYDSEVIRNMIDLMNEELDFKIRYLYIPMAPISTSVARKCAMESDIDQVYHLIKQEINQLITTSNKRNPLIVALCQTGVGGGIQLKNYIDQHSKLNYKTIALNMTDRDQLLREVINLQKTYNIQSFVGTYDPMLLGIPFIPISKIYETSPDYIDKVLLFKDDMKFNMRDFQNMNIQLDKTLEHVSMAKYEKIMSEVLKEFIEIFDLDENQIIGIYVHLACVIERLMEGKTASRMENSQELLSRYPQNVNIISKSLKRLEKAFKVIIDDHEIATLLVILRKL